MSALEATRLKRSIFPMSNPRVGSGGKVSVGMSSSLEKKAEWPAGVAGRSAFVWTT